jgi:adenosylcobinamide kinase/adenosylcobinamide-phosphate guanylyltransferase
MEPHTARVEKSRFILGGARSGKSRFAVTSQRPDSTIAFVATAQASDADMAARIARHRADRPPYWRRVEEPFDLVSQLDALADVVDGAIVDCLTLWVSNRLLRGDSDKAILDDAEALAALIERSALSITLVSNEVGEGVHPETAMGLRFRDLLGLVNQRMAAACDHVILMVAGIPLTIKRIPPGGRDADHAP